MPILQTFKRIIVEDFDEKDRGLVSKIAFSVNGAFDDLQNAFNKNISIENNLNLVKRDITVLVDASGNPVTPLQVKSNLSSACRGIQVIKAINSTNASVYPTGTPFITFSDENGLLNISNITNLQANNKYVLRLILYP